MHKLLPGLAAAALLAACETGPTVTTDADPAANFGAYRTYAWILQGAPPGMNPLTYERVKASIERQLAAQGYGQGSDADFAVAFTIGARDKVEVTQFGPYAGYYGGYGLRGGYRWSGVPVGGYDVRQVKEGSLVIDVYDVSSKKPVWHGMATQEVGSKVDQVLIDTAVASVLSRFPSRAGAAAAPGS